MTAEHRDWFDIPVTTDVVRGAVRLERTARGVIPHRLPDWVLGQVDDVRLSMAEVQPSGVRLTVRSAATVLEVDVVPTRVVYAGTPPRPEGVYDLLIDGRLVAQASADSGNTVTVDMSTGQSTTEQGPAATLRFDELPHGINDLELWLPHNESVEILAIRVDAPAEPASVTDRRVWLHHGSSISQGSNTTSPSATWTALTSTAAGVDLINLGFGGNALLDPCVARLMRDIPADLISVKMGINLVNHDLMRLRAFGPAVHGFLDTIRDGHPDVPLLVVSPVYCPIHENTPGPGTFDLESLRAGQVRFRATGDPDDTATGRLTLTVIRERLAAIVRQRQQTDADLHYIDGLELYGVDDFDEIPLPDALHPDAAGHRRIAERFVDSVFSPGRPFATGTRTPTRT